MCEESKMGESEKVPRFPLRKAPEVEGKFPFRDVRYYNNYDDNEVKSKVKVPRLGYLADLSIEYLKATGRKPELRNVPWFTTPESNASAGKR